MLAGSVYFENLMQRDVSDPSVAIGIHFQSVRHVKKVGTPMIQKRSRCSI